MTNDEILMLVAEVMTSGIKQDGARYTLPESMIIELVQRAQKAEREACAKLVEQYTGAWNDEGYALAQTIRARGEK